MNPDLSKYLIGVVAGIVVLVVFVLIFRKELSLFLFKLTEIRVTLPGGVKIDLTGNDAAAIATDLLREIDKLLKEHLTPEEKRLFLDVLRHRNPPLVTDVLPDFDESRPPALLKQLRALRGAYFIRPVEGSRWLPQKHIQVTTLGQIVAKHRRSLLESTAAPQIANDRNA